MDIIPNNGELPDSPEMQENLINPIILLRIKKRLLKRKNPGMGLYYYVKIPDPTIENPNAYRLKIKLNEQVLQECIVISDIIQEERSEGRYSYDTIADVVRKKLEKRKK